MMMSIGHEVYLYGAGDKNEAPCTEYIECLTRQEQIDCGFEKPQDNLNIKFDLNETYWQTMNLHAIKEMIQRIQPKDFICVIAGTCQQPIAKAFPQNITVEYGIGYSGVFSDYKVFESYAWMHTMYGSMYGTHQADGKFYDEVIPNSYEINKFPESWTKEEYYLYIGRLTQRKGYEIASQVCEKLGKRLIIAGQGTPPAYGEYVGLVGEKHRGELMAGATAVFVPTLYVGPWEGVAAESMLCGTPVITTDWGVFPEIVLQGKTGYRCRTFQEFCDATTRVANYVNREMIRDYAQSMWSTSVIRWKYQTYFDRLYGLWSGGWYMKGDNCDN
jgi:glycosyltransferase involved in cell wall biosynthesis